MSECINVNKVEEKREHLEVFAKKNSLYWMFMIAVKFLTNLFQMLMVFYGRIEISDAK